jgi:hypothetical protein
MLSPIECEKIGLLYYFNRYDFDRSEWVGRQNARVRVRFDIPIAIGIASFSSIGKGRASPA